MVHREFVRINEQADMAVLFIHGIVGTPNHFRDLVPLVPPTASVYNMLLDGHGKTARDFSRTSMKKWEAQVDRVVRSLCANHERLYIVAHSMGTLLALEQAMKNEKIRGLFLLAVPLRVWVKPRMFVNAFQVYFDRIRPNDAQAMAAKQCYGIERDKNLLHYFGWVPRYFELFSKIRKTRKTLGQLHTDCRAYQSKKDEMVARRSRKLLAQNPSVCVKELAHSGHCYYEKDDLDLLRKEFRKLLFEEWHTK